MVASNCSAAFRASATSQEPSHLHACRKSEDQAGSLLVVRVIAECGAERLEKLAVDRIGLRIVFGVPLDADGEAGRFGNADCLDRAVLCHTFDRDALAGMS